MIARTTIAVAALLIGAGCAADGAQPMNAAAEEPAAEKMSLDEALDDHKKVTLLDDETGEEKLICKRVVVTGDRFVRKTCATPKEWEQKKRDSQDELDGIKRRMDAKCGLGRAC